MWMNVHWKGPVTTAASTTLAHLFVPATEGTLSIASPTVEVSGLPLYGEAKPGSKPPLRLIFLFGDKGYVLGQWQ